jgi:tyrosyl-tRNA synthetase
MTNLYEEFQWRGLVYDTSEGLPDLLAKEKLTGYIGVDPTAPSLHIGSLLPMIALARLQRFGHTPIAIAGGGTGMIGDPSGKTNERSLLSLEEIERNLEGIKPQIARFLDFGAVANPARIVNNADWLCTVGLMPFLRDVGKYFTVNYMLQKESINRRLESEEGLSYTEFSYLLAQSWDFVQLFDRYGCTLQLGGSDQWGNITAGIDLVRKIRGQKVHALVMPLITTASGVKFGKTESGTIWLDPGRTPPQEFRQFWLNTDDRDVIKYLKYFTFLSRDEIAALERATMNAPQKREAQGVLADQVGQLVHGDAAARVGESNAVLFKAATDEDPKAIADRLSAIAGDVPSTTIAAGEFDGAGVSIVDIVVRVKLAASKSEARRLVEQGGVKVNERKTSDPNARLTRADAYDGRVFLVQKGARQRHVIQLT